MRRFLRYIADEARYALFRCLMPGVVQVAQRIKWNDVQQVFKRLT